MINIDNYYSFLHIRSICSIVKYREMIFEVELEKQY